MGVDAAVGLAAERGIPAVAKGIETADQLAELYRRGCPAGQGFLFARPMSIESVARYLSDARGGASVLRLAPEPEPRSDAA